MQIEYGPYSPSRIEVSSCPHRFYREYIAKDVEEDKSKAANRGTVVHEMLEIITRGWINDTPLKGSDVQKILPEKLAEHLITNAEDRKDIMRIVNAYIQNPPEGINDIVGTEENLALKFNQIGDNEWELRECDWDDPNCFVRGKIDILQIKDNVATIIDHKTQLYIPKNLGTFQMGFYAWLVKKFYPFVKEVKTVLHFCHYNLNTYRGPFTWTEEDLNYIESEMMVAIKTIESIEEFKEIAGQYCVYCPVKSECPRLRKIAEKKMAIKKAKNGPLLSAKMAQEHASAYHIMEENRKVMQSQLKDFTGEIGPVVIPGMEYGYKVSEGYEVPVENKKKLFDLLSRLGVDVWKYLNYDIKGLGKDVWKKVGESNLEEIKKLLVPTKKTKFGGRKV